MMAVERLHDRIGDGATCVAVFPDRGERYLDTIYSDAWVTTHFGAVPDVRAPDDASRRRSAAASLVTIGDASGGGEGAVPVGVP